MQKKKLFLLSTSFYRENIAWRFCFVLFLFFSFVHNYIQAIILESNPVSQILNAFDLAVNRFDVKTVRT